MRRIVVPEHGEIVRWTRKAGAPPDSERSAYLPEPLYRRLDRFEERLSRDGKVVFERKADRLVAGQWVGILQVPGLQVEILPKVDRSTHEGIPPGGEPWRQVRRNLLFMLAVAGDVPFRPRDVSRLATRRAPLSEALSTLFAASLMRELLSGCDRGYVTYEENLRVYKGRLLVGPQASRNGAHRERFYCRYDLFTEDTPLNRIFKAACRLLLSTTRTPPAQEALRHCLMLFDEVREERISEPHFDRVVFSRSNERFADLFHFSRLILSGHAPTASPGASRCFSLLYDMNLVFERFIAAVFRSRVIPRLPGCRIHEQGHRLRRPLYEADSGRGVLPLKPDMVLRHESTGASVVVDTKWKRLSVTAAGAATGISPGDLYQLYAYARRYGSRRSVLLYPRVPRVVPKDLHVLGEKDERVGQQVGVRFVDLHRDLQAKAGREALEGELYAIAVEGLGKAAGDAG